MVSVARSGGNQIAVGCARVGGEEVQTECEGYLFNSFGCKARENPQRQGQGDGKGGLCQDGRRGMFLCREKRTKGDEWADRTRRVSAREL